ncbi:expressed unknown protein [Seminavis robusta]|uniref:BACK domain-containing protein n=1 Tax=Seminavis robusta TaxID=568900 RepID=A0A9N8F523_9STRA|nr:expressed unknown protein [Seminavis robusta]|eukprot:Sro4110_g352950.1 n/a (303) ;mRNA; f:1599-2507
MPSLALIVVEAGAADNSALLTAAKRKALTIIRTREGISKEDSTLVANISETALEFFLQDDSETPREQHLLFEILQHWVGEDEERKTIAKELVHNHICLEKLDPDFLTSSVLPSGFCKTQQLMQAFQIQARAAKEKHGMFARPFTPSRAVWTSSGSITSTCEEFKTDLLKFPPIKDKTVRWTVEILNDAENVWLGIVKAGLDCACFDCLVGPGAGVAYSGKGSVLNSQTHCPKFDTGSKVTFTLIITGLEQVSTVSLVGSVDGGRPFIVAVLARDAWLKEGAIPAVSTKSRGSVRLLSINELK